MLAWRERPANTILSLGIKAPRPWQATAGGNEEPANPGEPENPRNGEPRELLNLDVDLDTEWNTLELYIRTERNRMSTWKSTGTLETYWKKPAVNWNTDWNLRNKLEETDR